MKNGMNGRNDTKKCVKTTKNGQEKCDVRDPRIINDYSFEEYWNDNKDIGKKQLAYLCYQAMCDIFRTEARISDILNFMDGVFKKDWGMTDMKPVWEVYDALQYVYSHMEFNGEFEGDELDEKERI